jgi:hypothetical protein
MKHLSLSIVSAFLLVACAAPTDSVPTAVSADDIVGVPQTEVDRLSIGSSWIYAEASWAESLHGAATGESLSLAPAYWTYWHWFDQIANAGAPKIATGGNWDTANTITKKYGLIGEADFVAATPAPAALAALNASLATGALAPPAARRDRALVRRELDRVWAVTPAVTQLLDDVFGADVSRTFASITAPAQVVAPLRRAQDFEVAYPSTPGGVAARKTLVQAAGEWRAAFYPASSGERRAIQLRIQRALADHQPIVITWFVDFNALEERDNGRLGSFNLATLAELGPGKQGGHAAVLESAQLDPAQVEFLRVKNSWGTAHPDRAVAPGMPSYHDLRLDYLDGPVKKCVERDGDTDTTNCPTTATPLQSVVLPPGY